MILLKLSPHGAELIEPRSAVFGATPELFTLGYSDVTPSPPPGSELSYPQWGLLTQMRCTSRVVEVLLDHVGAYPLYMARDSNEVWLGSDAWEVARHARLRRFNHAACIEMLVYEYALGPGTLIDGLVELSPGKLTTLRLVDGEWKLSESVRWQLEYTGRLRGSVEHRAQRAEENLRAACAPILDRARDSAAPLGLNLSGGWDSRAVLACLLPLGSESLFTCTYGDENFGGVKAARAASAAVAIPNRFYPFTDGRMLRDWFLTLCRELPPVIRFNLADGGHAVSKFHYRDNCGVCCGHSGDFFTGAPFYPSGKVQTKGDACAWLKRSMRSAFPREQLRRILRPENGQLADAPDEHLSESANEVFAPGYTGILRWKLEQRVRRAAIVELRVLERRTPVVYAPMLHRDFIEFWATVPDSDLAGQSLYKRMLATRLFTGIAEPLARFPREGGGSVREYGVLGRWKGLARKKTAGVIRRVAPGFAVRASAADPTAAWWRNEPELRAWAWQMLESSLLVSDLFDMGQLKKLIVEESLSDYPLARIGVWNLLTLAGAEQVLRNLNSPAMPSR